MKHLTWMFMAVALLLSACSSGPVRLTGDVDQSKLDLTRGERLEVSARGMQLLLFFPLGVNGRYERAMEELQSIAGKRVLTDVRIEERWNYAFIGTIYSTTISATAYPRK